MRKMSLNMVKEKVLGKIKKAADKAELATLKLKEQEGSLLEYLGEHIIAVVLIGIILAGIATVVGDIVMPGITDKIKNAFSFK